ncbi:MULTISPECIES: division/cell wall cluster transcriptional repressor MraZ [unclassified Oceanispirochaeta]|uniref:division/cell wall cluster transcriptional repressor MraZ n=1 Tax=unclassified Oceanispirochaeta TaxID=2635722 RepID=UPI000E095D82|nr:division/cell wall cluster transcriptional repressor MraZ [Oceanispirochaeta sp. M1]MBF9016132.1 division/cell wall cluster transcriptional repressor MraZ [Oceanispirochaeta sp. M2]NPD72594.1 division/cell wall cluster transcriptional repressor MraZ [Oceanispirochaeta sp. M1]RDG31746.1 division/cell wall cluster transcriptional repressor MraZ [Oceanispirochaeta sp. M1]
MEIKGIRGQYSSTLDEKGRMMLPAKLRSQVPLESLVLTKSVDRCLWLFPVEHWDRLVAGLREKKSLFSDQYQMIYRRLIAPAEEISIDKNGRINLLPSLMKSVDLTRDCSLIGMDDHIEIWDERVYEEYEEACAQSVKEGWGNLSGMGDLGL